jgi:hypothetical protein
VNYPNISKTRATNKLRLNSKALFHPSIKKENVIIIDDDTMESTEKEKGQSPVTSSHNLKNVKLELEEEHYNELVEKHRKDEKGKQIGEHPMRHVTRVAKKSSLNSKSLPKSSLKQGHLTFLKDNLEYVEIKQEFDYFPETEEIHDVQEMKISTSVEAEEVVGGSSLKDHNYEFRVKKTRFSIDLNQPTLDEDYTKFRVKIRDEK